MQKNDIKKQIISIIGTAFVAVLIALVQNMTGADIPCVQAPLDPTTTGGIGAGLKMAQILITRMT